MAVTHMARMVRFYNTVFESELTPFTPAPFDEKKTTFYRGTLAGINLLFCPNDIAGVEATTNRHQFNFVVGDVFLVMQMALQHGGSQIDGPQIVDGVITASVRDPDGNSIEFIQLKDNDTA
jgi:catechol 2,3-dioxygenase-like lactoylglutathione lyase family enzyme